MTVLFLAYRQLTIPLLPEDTSLLLRWLQKDPLTLGFLVIAMSLLIWQVSFAIRYKPFARPESSKLPKLTVVVPAFNEGKQIFETIKSVLASDYPVEQLQLICIDDGSQDDTWRWMKSAEAEFENRLTLIKQPYNQGKRAALMAGFAKAHGEVIVTLDSDSEVLPNTLAEMVSPFVQDERIGCVAGNVRVLNKSEGIIPKMLEVSFTSAFDFIRAGQSVYGGVFCTPGALSAYKTTVLKPLIQEWSEQHFMGKPATIGEDRALTNLVLASGHRVVYQRTATVFTKVPVQFGGLRRMLTRWARSNVRENLVMLTYVFKSFRTAGEGANWVRLFSVMQIIRMTIFEALKCVLLVALLRDYYLVSIAIIFGCVTAAIIPSTVYYLRYQSLFGVRWAVPFSYFWLFCLAWIPIWGMFTASNSGWLTRAIAQPTEEELKTSEDESSENIPVAA